MEDNKNEILDEKKDKISEDEKEEEEKKEEKQTENKEGNDAKKKKKKKHKMAFNPISNAIKLLNDIRKEKEKGNSQNLNKIADGIIEYMRRQVEGNVSNEIIEAYKQKSSGKWHNTENFESFLVKRMKNKFNFEDNKEIFEKVSPCLHEKAKSIAEEFNEERKNLDEASKKIGETSEIIKQKDYENLRKGILTDVLTDIILLTEQQEVVMLNRKLAVLRAKRSKQTLSGQERFSVGDIISFPCEEKRGLKKIGIVVNVDLNEGRNDVLCLNSEPAKNGKLRLNLAMDNQELLLSEIKDKDGKVLFKSAFDNDKKISYLSRDTYRNSNDEVEKAEFLTYLPTSYAKNIIAELKSKQDSYDKELYDGYWQITYDKVIQNLDGLTRGLGPCK